MEDFNNIPVAAGFSQVPYTKHQKLCLRGKKRLSGALTRAKEAFNNKKCQLEFQSSHVTLEFKGTSLEQVDGSRGLGEPSNLASGPAFESLQSSSSDTNPVSPLPLCTALLSQSSNPTISVLEADNSHLKPFTVNGSSHPPASTCMQSIRDRVKRFFNTPRNMFGLFRRFHREELPSHDPEDSEDSDTSEDTPTPFRVEGHSDHSFSPYPNKSCFRLGDWYWNYSVQKSQKSFRQLIDIIGNPSFCPEDIQSVKWSKINKDLGLNNLNGEWLDQDAGWQKTPVTISVPFHSRSADPGTHDHHVTDLFHHSLIQILRNKLTNPHDDQLFHYEPYKLFCHPSDQLHEARVHSEAYTSDTFLKTHYELQESPPQPGCNLQRVVAGFMFSSDSTQLTSFGNAKLWPLSCTKFSSSTPLYVYFANESKYCCAKSSCHLCNHAVYFQSLPDSFKDFAKTHTSNSKLTSTFMTHCQCKCFHAQWCILLDDEFLYAYQHGVIIKCCDGIDRRFYPHILIYSADYPEKILIASIKNLGNCPCPRCLTPMTLVPNRKKVAVACDLIDKKNYAVNSNKVNGFLMAKSLFLTLKAFSHRLGPLGFNVYLMFVVNFMHEVELGVWRSLFVHVLWILDTVNGGLLDRMDLRYRQIPTYRSDTIRQFTTNTSEMRRVTAHHLENLLQCAIPVFNGLILEPHNTQILSLLLCIAPWHGLAKLCIHTDNTLKILDAVTKSLGDKLHRFAANTCSAFCTRELRGKADAQRRRQIQQGTDIQLTSSGAAQKPKTFNLQTYKLHALGNYPAQIRFFGTTDSYSTEPIKHWTGKSRYKKTSKKTYTEQLTHIERREAHIHLMCQKLGMSSEDCAVAADQEASTLDDHHHIGKSQNSPLHITFPSKMYSRDPACTDFVPNLKVHLPHCMQSTLLAPIVSKCHLNDPSPNQQPSIQVILKNDRIYTHSIFCINYTTYNIRRAQDVVNPRMDHCNIMLLAPLDGFDTNLWYELCGPLDRETDSGWYKLNMLCFVPMAEDDAFGFVNPANVLRSCHLVPAFHEGKLHPNGIRMSKFAQDAQDWCYAQKTYQYVSYRFVDRDMMMQYHWGLGIGHTYARVNYQSDQLDKDNGEDSDVFIEEDVNLEFTLQDCEGEDFGYNQDSDEDSDTDKLLLDLDGTDVVGYNYD
ncbi:hypothetical protein SERLADRAFT_371382 [Serpula lacrymans var. lacrymans S7.9]|uniref:Uncharacterized protein n=1 Tax=Serpula lacrymans var. lacrymans (strain S7.9) TaxID=578457 RepID=F8P1X3_SERL9|nr:uncharacterized protein SERLADRAFT_371382 [Serpula lacrymans var. lacrymans S7.9]EGO23151.1 hypothetical protein SERLADRAFT_371382 [Serpula lacrymans var. lacrymans S7.9]